MSYPIPRTAEGEGGQTVFVNEKAQAVRCFGKALYLYSVPYLRLHKVGELPLSA